MPNIEDGDHLLKFLRELHAIAVCLVAAAAAHSITSGKGVAAAIFTAAAVNGLFYHLRQGKA